MVGTVPSGTISPQSQLFHHMYVLINILLNLRVDLVQFSRVLFLCDSSFSVLCLLNSSCLSVPRYSSVCSTQVFCWTTPAFPSLFHDQKIFLQVLSWGSERILLIHFFFYTQGITIQCLISRNLETNALYILYFYLCEARGKTPFWPKVGELACYLIQVYLHFPDMKIQA